jgi:hypothetical protein
MGFFDSDGFASDWQHVKQILRSEGGAAFEARLPVMLVTPSEAGNR